MTSRLTRISATAIALFTLILAYAGFALEPAPSAEEVQPIQVGEKAPEVGFLDPQGEETALKDLHSESSLVLVYYRGDWCPYCSSHLRALKEVEDELKSLGCVLAAVSPDRPEILAKTLENEDISYRLLSDAGMEAAGAFGIAFKVDPVTVERYRGFGIDLEAASGYDHHVLPVPAIFLIDREGTIQWVHADPDYSKRLDPSELVETVKRLSNP